MIRRITLALVVLTLAAGCSATSAVATEEATSPSRSTSAVPSPVASAKGWLAYQSFMSPISRAGNCTRTSPATANG